LIFILKPEKTKKTIKNSVFLVLCGNALACVVVRRHAVINCGSRAVEISEKSRFIRFSRNLNNIKSPNHIYIYFYVFPHCITNLIKTIFKNQLLFEALTWLNVCSMELSLLFIVLKEILCPMCNLKPGKLIKIKYLFFPVLGGSAVSCVAMRGNAMTCVF